MERVDLDPDKLSDPRWPLDLASYCALMECAARDTGDFHFGLRFGQDFQPERLGLIGELALASPTLGAALFNLARFFPYHQQVTESCLHHEDGMLKLEYRILDGGIMERRQDAELTMGMFRNVVCRCIGSGWSPEQVHFEHPAPPDAHEHERMFGSSIYFGQRTNALVWRATELDRPMPGSDPLRMARLRDELVRLAGGIGQISVVDRVRGEIRSTLNTGAPHIESVAAAMGVARWTLQRRLAAGGYTFSDLVEEVRRAVAMQYLREPYLPVADVATLLGYSETSAFTRSCTRWFGACPTTIRQTCLS
ncbi:MAG: AraC family transcriptional regulator [Burkholderiaceae bacterium]